MTARPGLLLCLPAATACASVCDRIVPVGATRSLRVMKGADVRRLGSEARDEQPFGRRDLAELNTVADIARIRETGREEVESVSLD